MYLNFCFRYTQSGWQYSSSSMLYCHPEYLIYTIWQFKESTSHSLFETSYFVHAIWSYFFNKRLFINMQRLTVHFISTIPNVIHVFGHVFFCKACNFFFHCKWTVKHAHVFFCHIRVRSITFEITFAKRAVCQCDKKGTFIELHWRQPRVYRVIEDYACGRINGQWALGGAIF